MSHDDCFDVTVIGAGMFGTEVALNLAALGHRVLLLEQSDQILSGASRNNQNRLHLGFHYPRDIETAKQSIEGYRLFQKKYGPAVVDNFPNYYFIANSNTRSSPAEFVKFCDSLRLPYSIVDPRNTPINYNLVDLAVKCSEAVYDVGVLADLIKTTLGESEVKLVTSAEVFQLCSVNIGFKVLSTKGSFFSRAVVNCAYHNINKFNIDLGIPGERMKFQQTVLPIIEWEHAKCGLTVMDGEFFTLLPFGKTDKFLLYHVVHSVLSSGVGKDYREIFKDFSQLRHKFDFKTFLLACVDYLPGLENATLKGLLHGPRVVRAGAEATDSRVSASNSEFPGYYQVLSGKIDHAIRLAVEVGKDVDRFLYNCTN